MQKDAIYEVRAIDLFSLYVFFSHFRPRDATRGNSFFQMLSHARANVRITNDKNKRKIPMRASRGLKWENKMYKLKRSINLRASQERVKTRRGSQATKAFQASKGTKTPKQGRGKVSKINHVSLYQIPNKDLYF